MTKVIFVHGISVREPNDSQTFEHIQTVLCQELELPKDKVVRCTWGDSLGGRLNAAGASIPLYDSTRSVDQASQLDENIVRWMQLYQDPLYELRLLSLSTEKPDPFSNSNLKDKVKNFRPSELLKSQLKEGGIEEVFEQAIKTIVDSTAYKNVAVIQSKNIIATAIIAEAIAICNRQYKFVSIVNDSSLRENIIEKLGNEIDSSSERGAGKAIISIMAKLLQSPVTNYLKRERGLLSDISNPFVGDVLLYQGRGQKIRGLIKSYIQDTDEPVVLLAHSLGGIACVDLLIQEQLNDQVKLLVTVGSQAPYFYEINALQSLEFGEPLPEHFPSWLNIYDLQDFVSYIGGNIFPDKVQDILVDNKKPFPDSHGAYWKNSAAWKAIVQRIKVL